MGSVAGNVEFGTDVLMTFEALAISGGMECMVDWGAVLARLHTRNRQVVALLNRVSHIYVITTNVRSFTQFCIFMREIVVHTFFGL